MENVFQQTSKYQQSSNNYQMNNRSQMGEQQSQSEGQSYGRQTYNNGDYQFNTIHSDNTHLETEVMSHFIVINSKDRHWTSSSNETPYNFTVKLGGSSGNRHSVINDEFKNVSYIEVKQLILSDRPDTNGSNITTTKLSSQPYIHCNLKNLSKTINGTNSVFDTSMGIFTPSIVATTTDNYNYITFNNIIEHGKSFLPIPLNTIQQLDIQLLNPMGNSIKDKKDVLDIKSIHINNETSIGKNDYLIITTTHFFDNNEFKIGDTIECRDYEYHDLSYTESYQFNNFINNSNCHIVTNIGKTNKSSELYDQLHIQYPSLLSRYTGNLSVSSWFSSFLTKTLDITPTTSTSGKLINLSTQSHIVLNIDTLHHSTNNKYFNNLI